MNTNTKEEQRNDAAGGFNIRFSSSQPTEIIFNHLLDIPFWWSGLFGETIVGQSKAVGDVFDFKAGGGVHHTIHRLIDMVPNSTIAWQVVHSHLDFVDIKNEWNNTTIRFTLTPLLDGTEVLFEHIGLVPEFQCYHDCSLAWSGYMDQLRQKLG